MTENRVHAVNVRFTAKGMKVIDEKRGQISRGSYIRQALAFAINMGFTPKEEL